MKLYDLKGWLVKAIWFNEDGPPEEWRFACVVDVRPDCYSIRFEGDSLDNEPRMRGPDLVAPYIRRKKFTDHYYMWTPNGWLLLQNYAPTGTANACGPYPKDGEPAAVVMSDRSWLWQKCRAVWKCADWYARQDGAPPTPSEEQAPLFKKGERVRTAHGEGTILREAAGVGRERVRTAHGEGTILREAAGVGRFEVKLDESINGFRVWTYPSDKLTWISAPLPVNRPLKIGDRVRVDAALPEDRVAGTLDEKLGVDRWRVKLDEDNGNRFWSYCEQKLIRIDEPAPAEPTPQEKTPLQDPFKIGERVTLVNCDDAGRKLFVENSFSAITVAIDLVTGQRYSAPHEQYVQLKCRHAQLRYIHNGEHAGKIGCCAEGCEALFECGNDDEWRRRQPCLFFRGPDTLGEDYYSYIPPDHPNAFLVCARNPGGDLITYFWVLPLNEAAQPPIGGWGFKVAAPKFVGSLKNTLPAAAGVFDGGELAMKKGDNAKLLSFGWTNDDAMYHETLYVKLDGTKVATEYYEKQFGREYIKILHGDDVVFESDGAA